MGFFYSNRMKEIVGGQVGKWESFQIQGRKRFAKLKNFILL